MALLEGSGVEPNEQEAYRWVRRSGEAGYSAHAMRGLGFMLLTGEGGPRDAAVGFAYIRLAADAGDESAVKGLSRFEPQLSDEERLATRRIAAQWRRDHGPATTD
jgi:uncharacterized protein